MSLRRIVAACGAAAAFVLVGCASHAVAGAPHPSGHTTGSVRAASPTASPTPDSPTPSPAPTFATGYLVPDSPSAAERVPGQYLQDPSSQDIYPVQIPVDSGPIPYTQGTPILEGSRIVAYRVASGDLGDFIEQRFGLSQDNYIEALNSVRRGPWSLYAGDVVNLSASTLHKYGSVNGRVLNGPEPDPEPPQER